MQARSFVVSAPLQMTLPARAVGDKAFKAVGSGLCSLFFEVAHYAKSPEPEAGLRPLRVLTFARSEAKAGRDFSCEQVVWLSLTLKIPSDLNRGPGGGLSHSSRC